MLIGEQLADTNC